LGYDQFGWEFRIAFDRKFEPGPVEMECFEATLRCRRLIERSL
jgi:hypothetical protein